MKYTTVVWMLCLGTISGCASIGQTSIVLPNGSRGLVVDCSHTQWSSCFVAAGTLCPNGYNIFERAKGEFTESKIPLTEMENSSGKLMIPQSSQLQLQKLEDKYMVISCTV